MPPPTTKPQKRPRRRRPRTRRRSSSAAHILGSFGPGARVAMTMPARAAGLGGAGANAAPRPPPHVVYTAAPTPRPIVAARGGRGGNTRTTRRPAGANPARRSDPPPPRPKPLVDLYRKFNNGRMRSNFANVVAAEQMLGMLTNKLGSDIARRILEDGFMGHSVVTRHGDVPHFDRYAPPPPPPPPPADIAGPSGTAQRAEQRRVRQRCRCACRS